MPAMEKHNTATYCYITLKERVQERAAALRKTKLHNYF